MSVIAKFRCLQINERYDGTFTAELRPVQQKGNNSKENAEFWSYSPSGECSLYFHKLRPLELGAYYYILMEKVEYPEQNKAPDQEPYWVVESFTSFTDGGGQVDMRGTRVYDWQKGRPEGFINGSFKMSMEPKASAAIRQLNAPGSKWRVTFKFAEASDGES